MIQRMGARGRKLSTQILVFQTLILVGTLLIGSLLAVHAARQRLDREYEHRALGIAQTVAATPEIVRAIAARDRSGVVQRRAEAIRRATGTSTIVVTDARGIRYSHVNPARIGHRVSTDPSIALAGHVQLAVQTGTLGRSARAKVPLRDGSGRVIGIVSVNILQKKFRKDLAAALPIIALYAGTALLLGLVASVLLARRLKRQTFGLEPSDLAELLREREATLWGIREGVIATDQDGRVQVVNKEARRLLDLREDVTGRRVTELADARLGELLAGELSGEDVVFVHGERVLLANRRPVRADGRDLGSVVTLRDRTELEALARELDSVRGLTDAMRAQSHEFSNRLYTISGLLQLEHYDQALDFIREVTKADAALRSRVRRRVADSRVAALLVAKSVVAAERGVDLRVSTPVRLEGELTDPLAVITVLGNLIDNALDAAKTGDASSPWVEVSLAASADGTLVIGVADSGCGIHADERERVFEPGYSTKPASESGSRGVGLALVRRTVERRGGTITLDEPEAGRGARFQVRLPDAVRGPVAGTTREAASVAP
jgi:two-component system CitB family sensor kinase